MIVADAGLNGKLQLAAIIGSVAMVFIVFELVRERRLMERYSLLWMAASLILLLLAIFSGALGKIASVVGIATPSNALFGLGLAFATFMLLHFSTSISRLTDQNKVLAQKLAATEERLRRLERSDQDG
ncbi:MAG: DUF2304 domain-containing protein [Solirubrobacterales bacterium]